MDVVAMTSVITTGIVSPLILAISTRMQVDRTARDDHFRDRRQVLDDTAQYVGQHIRSSGYCLSQWSRGVSDTDAETLETLKARSNADEGLKSTYAKLCIRYGPNSEVARRCLECMDAMEANTMLLKQYRAGVLFETLGTDVETLMVPYHEAFKGYLEAAHKAAAGRR
ncbi:hypothetical protein [Streptomyces sp. NPDC057616]|uniref:hypothetical protein n=1 Tax=Streptomyces sp. NPDC057616 TaxID=3346183 RepID=UPI0036C31E47